MVDKWSRTKSKLQDQPKMKPSNAGGFLTEIGQIKSNVIAEDGVNIGVEKIWKKGIQKSHGALKNCFPSF